MEGNVVKAAWILGGSILASVVVAGVGILIAGTILVGVIGKKLDVLSQRSAEAVMNAPKNTMVSLKANDGAAIKVGFEPKLPLAIRAENSLDDATGKRAAFEVDVKPNLQK